MNSSSVSIILSVVSTHFVANDKVVKHFIPQTAAKYGVSYDPH